MSRARVLIVALAFVMGCWPPLEDIEGGSADAAADRGDARVAYRDLVLADRPLLYWRFGEKSGKKVEDATGHGYTGTYYEDATLGAPGAIAFDPDTAMGVSGTTGSTAVGDSDDPDPTSVAPYTIELWFAPASQISDGQMLVAKQSNDANGDEAIGLGLDPVRGLFFNRYVAGAPLAVEVTSLPPVGKFTYVAGVYDGTKMVLYVDGSPVGQTPDARPLAPKAGGWRLGMSYADHGIFHGTIDEFALYAAALTPDQIKSHHDVGLGR